MLRPTAIASAPRADYRLFFAWLAAFYTTWLLLVFGGGRWPLVLEHWPIGLAMLLGSYVAGSTPMGGGTIGFPVLVLLLGAEPTLGRDFSFAVQSIGMTSASIYILCSRRPVAWSLLVPAMIGSLIGTPLGILLVAPYVGGVVIKVLFAVIWASFGILTLTRIRELAALTGFRSRKGADRIMGLAVGLFGGGFLAASTGVGIDMLLYATLVLVSRADLRVAIPTSIILMSFTSLVGIGFKSLLGDVQPGVFANWLAAAPVVALGAPIGAMVVQRIGRVPTLAFVSVLCLGQLVWTYYENWPEIGAAGVAIGAAALAGFQLLFWAMHRAGRRLHSPGPQEEAAAQDPPQAFQLPREAIQSEAAGP